MTFIIIPQILGKWESQAIGLQICTIKIILEKAMEKKRVANIIAALVLCIAKNKELFDDDISTT